MTKPAAAATTQLDPDNVQSRLYKQLGRILEDMENGGDTTLRERIQRELGLKRATDATLRERIEDALAEHATITTAERIRAFTAIARVLTVFAALRKDSNEPGDRGSAVRKYATAFRQAPDATRRRARGSRSSAIDAALAAVSEDDDDAEDGAA